MKTTITDRPLKHQNFNDGISFEDWKNEVRRLTMEKRGLLYDNLGPFKDEIWFWYSNGATPYMVASENE